MKKELFYCVDVLELPSSTLDFLNNRADSNKLAIDLKDFKERVARQRRTLAKEYHPDVCKDGGKKMVAINDAVDFVNGLRVMQAQRQQSFWGFGTAATSSTTTSFNFTFNNHLRKFFDDMA